MIAPFSRRLAIILCAAFCAALAACGQSQPEREFVADANSAVTGQFIAGQTLSEPITGRSDALNFAVLTLPAGAGRGKLTEKQYANGWRQSASLDNAKMAGDWSDLSIDIMGPEPAENGAGVIRIAKPTQESVRNEILARFRGVPMRIAARPMYNALGPFGLAVGAGPDDMRCAYAWQWVDNLAAAARGEKANFFNSGDMAASIRLRLCRRGVTADQLAAWYERLEIADPANVARIAEAMRNNAYGQTAGGGVVVDTSETLEATLIGAHGPPRASAARHAAHRHAQQPRAKPSFAPETPAPMTTPSSPSADGRQYLAPVGGGAPQYVASAPATRGAGFGLVRGVDPGLPAQAYRGPASARAVVPPTTGGAPLYLGPATR